MLKYLLPLWIALLALGCSTGDVADEGSNTGIIRFTNSPQYLRMPFHEGPPNWPEIRNKESQWASAVGLRFNQRDYPGPVEELWFRAGLPEGLEDDSSIYLFGNLPSFEVYLEEDLLRHHVVEEGQRQGLSWYLIRLPLEASGKTLYIRAYDAGSSVDIEDLSIGSERAGTDILERQIKAPLSSDVPSIVYGLFFSLFGYIVIVLSLYLPKPSNRAALAFGVLGALYGTRILIGSQLSRLVFDAPPIVWNYLNDFLTYLMPVASTLFFVQILGKGWKSVIRRLLQLHILYAAVAMVIDLVVGVPGTAMAPNNYLVVFGQIIILAHVFRPGQPRTREVVMLRVGFVFIAVFIILSNFGFLTQVGEAIGLLVFLCCLGDVVVHRVMGEQKQLVGYRQELETARRIQANILPETMPRTKGLDIAVRYVPMAEVAGDFYDFLSVREKSVGILIADVSGHGVPAALIASMVKVAFSAQEERAEEASQVLSDMNRIFCGKMKSQFVTAGYIYIDLHENHMIYSTAGHPPLLIWRKSLGKVEEIRLNGMLMGHVPDARYEDTKVDIEPGDRVVLYTDGIVEATNSQDEFFGKERLVELIETENDLSAEAFADHLLTYLSSWTGKKLEGEGFEDDLTFVVTDIKEI